MPGKKTFTCAGIGNEMLQAGFTCAEGDKVWLFVGVTSITVRLAGRDMFGHPDVGFANDEQVEETQGIRRFIDDLIEDEVSPRLRWCVLQLIYDDEFRQRFLALSPEGQNRMLEKSLPDPKDRQLLLQVTDRLQTAVEDFKPGKVVDDGDHFLLFPQTVDKIAPRAWFEAAWPFISHFRSNFGFYLGEALLYSRITIVGGATSNPAVTAEQEAFLKRQASRLVERIAVNNANDLHQVLQWGVGQNVRFGLGNEVTEMILKDEPTEEIMAAIQAKFETREEMESMAR